MFYYNWNIRGQSPIEKSNKCLFYSISLATKNSRKKHNKNSPPPNRNRLDLFSLFLLHKPRVWWSESFNWNHIERYNRTFSFGIRFACGVDNFRKFNPMRFWLSCYGGDMIRLAYQPLRLKYFLIFLLYVSLARLLPWSWSLTLIPKQKSLSLLILSTLGSY